MINDHARAHAYDAALAKVCEREGEGEGEREREREGERERERERETEREGEREIMCVFAPTASRCQYSIDWLVDARLSG